MWLPGRSRASAMMRQPGPRQAAGAYSQRQLIEGAGLAGFENITGRGKDGDGDAGDEEVVSGAGLGGGFTEAILVAFLTGGEATTAEVRTRAEDGAAIGEGAEGEGWAEVAGQALGDKVGADLRHSISPCWAGGSYMVAIW